MTDIIAILANEPFQLPLRDILSLTPYQVFAIYLRPRDKYGRIKINNEPLVPASSTKSTFETWAELNKLPIWLAEPLWKRWAAAAKVHLEK